MTDQTPVVEALKALLAAKKIQTVALIDDAYYARPSSAFFTGDRLATLRANITSWTEPIPEFSALNLQVEADSDITDSLIDNLWEIRAKSPEIASWFSEFDQSQREKRGVLQPLINLLESKLGCSVLKLSPADNLDPAQLPELIFVDYYLDLSDRAEDSLAIAETIGERIKTNFAKSHRPLVILMSSKTTVTPIMKTQFREKAALLGGMFYFIPKSELSLQGKTVITLAVLVTALEEGRTIERFIQALDTDIHNATEKFTRRIKGLTIEDYAYMQRLSLHGEGMPLGDYLLWLFGSYFGTLLFKSAPNEHAALDLMRFNVIPESDSSPSSEFVDLYRNLVAEEVSELGPHPHAPAESGELPNPHFGDVFIHENEKDILMVITPECDLMYAPDADAERPADPNQSVVLMPGVLMEQGGRIQEDEASTTFVPYKEKTYKIVWRLKAVEVKTLKELGKDLLDRKFKRKLRLHHPFSTETQHLFIRDFGRVGIPVAPPSLRTVEVAVCYKDEHDVTRQIPVDHPSAILYVDREGRDHVQLKLTATSKVVEVAESVQAMLESMIAAEEGDTNSKKKWLSRKERIERFLNDLDAQIRLRQALQVSAGKHKEIPNCPIEILRDPTNLEKRLGTAAVVILVREEEVFVAAGLDGANTAAAGSPDAERD